MIFLRPFDKLRAQDERAGRAAFVARLERAARRLGQARGESRARERKGDARRWRMPGMLWPLFGKER